MNEDIKHKDFRFISKIIIGHIRLASCGRIAHRNTHPFIRGGWAFAHNGTVTRMKNESEFALSVFKPLGDTDSEYAFCYLLERIVAEPENIREVLERECKKIKQFGKFNFLMSDGYSLYAYGDDSLYYTVRKTPFNHVKLIDLDFELNLAEIKKPDEKACIIATEPLTYEEDWLKIEALKIFRDGKIIT